jgi:hypothetical protein
MLERIRRHVTYANVMSTLALFLALGGGLAWALANDSVKSKHIKDGQVKPRDLAPTEAWRVVGAPGEPQFTNLVGCAWSNFDSNHQNAAFFRDASGVVHLKGLVKAGAGCDFASFFLSHPVIFNLPEGYRPARRSVHAVIANNQLGRVNVDHSGEVRVDNDLAPNNAKTFLQLDGITFRCHPRGADGCRG